MASDIELLTSIDVTLKEILETVRSQPPSSRVDDDGFITVEDAARISALSVTTLRRAVAVGKLEAFDVGLGDGGRPTWRIQRKRLEEYLLSRKGGSQKEKASSYKSRHLGGSPIANGGAASEIVDDAEGAA